jgi:uncharacterized protein YdiU (UPF0061 family)
MLAVAMLDFRFDNAFVHDLPGDTKRARASARSKARCGRAWSPTPVAAPRLLAYSPEMAQAWDREAECARLNSPGLRGNALLPGMEPFAANYGGHQFGHWAGQLGDGRAITLGELINAAGERWELQLKGAGLTPYSRTADGRACCARRSANSCAARRCITSACRPRAR